MSELICYLCSKTIPKRQSIYEDHGVQVCLHCFHTTSRCQKCNFPSKSLQSYPDVGKICEFCQEITPYDEGEPCYLCGKSITARMPRYADYEKIICQECFQDAEIRCFLCRFPHIQKEIQGLGGVCEFCHGKALNKDTEITSLLTPLSAFLQQHKHRLIPSPEILWTDKQLLVGMQTETPPKYSIRFFDEYIYYYYPVYYLKGRFYIIHQIHSQWFICYMLGQLVAADLCKKYNLPHLQGQTPFHEIARGWCHYLSMITAKVLKYSKVRKHLSRWPENELSGSFSKFLAMSEYRPHKEVILFAHKTLQEYGEKYL